jgi:hypothetical protein
VKYLALTFVVELQGQVPWSLLDYDATSLAELLDAQKFFTQWTGSGYAFIENSAVPPPPLMSAAYVAAHNFLCTDRPKTIAEAVFWTRNLVLANGEADSYGAQALAYWQYAGSPPGSRMLSGTFYNGLYNGTTTTNLTQWTSGCHATTALTKALLRTLNIPVEHFDNKNPTVSDPGDSFVFNGHAVPHFTSEHLWMSHADDTYQNTFWGPFNILPFPIQAFEISDSQFYAWYPSGTTTMNEPVGQDEDLIWATYGTQTMLSARLTDLTTLPTPPDTNICANVLTSISDGQNTYTCADAESFGLLGNIDPLVTPYVYSGQAALTADEYNMPYYYSLEAQFLPPPCNTCVASVCAKNAACCTGWSYTCETISNAICDKHGCDYCGSGCF